MKRDFKLEILWIQSKGSFVAIWAKVKRSIVHFQGFILPFAQPLRFVL